MGRVFVPSAVVGGKAVEALSIDLFVDCKDRDDRAPNHARVVVSLSVGVDDSGVAVPRLRPGTRSNNRTEPVSTGLKADW